MSEKMELLDTVRKVAKGMSDDLERVRKPCENDLWDAIMALSSAAWHLEWAIAKLEKEEMDYGKVD